ncbi:unnamed protein product [Dibothriocephalus latus]|uniref:Uncharacterized protein n=1 Tax=Dibothriocephalus latus TaxID=60516 RepID=A0A3P7P2I4_DIBLA|nr:unnamed protein product [Dibothriocephalus latus]
MRGAETGNAYGPDHALVRTRLKVHLSSAPKLPRARRLDVAKLRHPNNTEALSTESRSRLTTQADIEDSSRCGKPSTLCDSVRDVNDGFIADNSAKVDHWREHFKHLHNFDEQPITSSPSSTAEIQPSPAYAVSCDSPSEDEVADAMQRLRTNKACREYGISAEIYKSCVDTLAHRLHAVIVQAWREEAVPDDWGSGILVPVHRRGYKTKCENYHGISLINVAAIVFAIVLLTYFQSLRDSRTRPTKAGFRAGRRCADQMFTLRRILEFRYS